MTSPDPRVYSTIRKFWNTYDEDSSGTTCPSPNAGGAGGGENGLYIFLVSNYVVKEREGCGDEKAAHDEMH